MDGHLLLLEGFALFPEGPGERDDGHLFLEKLGLLLLERRPKALQLGSLLLDFPSLLLRCDPLDVTLAGNPC